MTLSWADCERRFIAADAHKPENKRFEGWKKSQTEAYNRWVRYGLESMLLFFPTGEGKSKTSLAIFAVSGVTKLLVIAPPKTHSQWQEDARVLGLSIDVISVEGFRQPSFKPKRDTWLIFDEFHMAGTRTGEGWKKLRKLKAGFPRKILCSATPQYNDAERVYCADVICNPGAIQNYGDWLDFHCTTTPNRFAFYPIVTGFRKFDGPIDWYLSHDWVAYVEDTATWDEGEVELEAPSLRDFNRLGYSRRHHMLMNSSMQARHKRAELLLINEDGYIWDEHADALLQYMDNVGKGGPQPWLVFAMHKEVGLAFHRTLIRRGYSSYYIDGDVADIEPIKQEFLADSEGILIGTTALATGVDGIDKHCQRLLILDPIEGDKAKERQLIGRILPRGTDDGIERYVVRVVFT